MSIYIPLRSSEMKHPVRRCLFERPTPEKQEKDFETQESRLFKEEAKVFREKWGLDPTTGSLVNGAEYECVPVDTSREFIPSFYMKGYAPRKPRPVQSLRRERSPFGLSLIPTRLNFDCPKPVKRRLSIGDGENFNSNENIEIFHDENVCNKRVPADGEIVHAIDHGLPTSSLSSSMKTSLSSSVDASNSPMSLPRSFEFLLRSKGLESRSLPDISPRSTDLSTPQQRPRSLTQKTMKDYLPCKKPRTESKVLPRT